MDATDDRGQTTPLVVLVLVAALAAVVLLVRLDQIGVTRSRAQTAADAAALAGVVEGRTGAAQLARDNGAVLVSFDSRRGEVQVTVEVGAIRATARAGRKSRD